MRKGTSLIVVATLVALASALSAASQGPTSSSASGRTSSSAQTSAPRPASPADSEQYAALVGKFCISCHSDRAKAGGLSLENRDLSRISADAPVWEKVVRKVRASEMPPVGMPRPEKALLDGFAAHLETTLDRAYASHPNPGRTMVHRLNRAEYANAIRDLFAIDVDVSSLLPPDDSAFGFDNIAQMLTLSPVLLERYLLASAKITRLAIGDPSVGVLSSTYSVRPDLTQDNHIEGLPLGTVGGLVVRHYFPLDGEYQFEPKLARTIFEIIRGLERPHVLEITLDGVRVKQGFFGGTADDLASHNENQFITGQQIEGRLKLRMKVPAGEHTIGVAFLAPSLALTAEVWQPFERTSGSIYTDQTKGNPHLSKLIVTGPFEPTGAGDTDSRRRIFVCRRAAPQDEVACARKILATAARRAYRRPVAGDEIDELVGIYRRERQNDQSFDQGIGTALRRVISGPEFLFRVPTVPPAGAPNAPYRISDLELASRLSFFLWSTIPDDELLNLAIEGKLKEPRVLEQQVRRLLADGRSSALGANFAGQWLELRNVHGSVPDGTTFPDFDDNLRESLIRETELFFESIISEDRSATDLLTADYTFVNERLARHYGIPGVYGTRFRRVPVTDEARKGLLGQGSVLTLTATATRTSPVVRGKWVLTNLLGTPPPPPPPNVPSLEEGPGAKPMTLRERMAAHRANVVCANCHKVMDPIGFSLENFDAVGRWRTKDAGAPIDAADTVFNGTKIDGVVGLREFLMSLGAARGEVFVQTMTEKLMTYALGRAVDYYDMPVVRKIVRDSARNNYKMSSIILGIITSPPFQRRMDASQPNDSPAAVTAAAGR